MSTTESRTGFRLPWSSDRSHESQSAETSDEPTAEAEDLAASGVVWPDSDFNARLGVTPTQPRPYEPPPGEQQADAVVQPTPEAAPQEPAMLDTAPTPPAPVARRKPSKLMVDLTAAIRATAEAARDEALAKIDADVAVVVAEIRAGSKEGEIALKHRSDQDIAEIREWSKAEIARIKEETEARIEARKAGLADEIAAYADEIETRVGAVESLASGYRGEMTAYSARLAQEDDPARLATMAETLPDAPALAAVVEADVADLPQPEPVAEVVESAEAVAAEAWSGSEAPVEPGAIAEAEVVVPEAEVVVPEAEVVVPEVEPVAEAVGIEAEVEAGPVAETAPVAEAVEVTDVETLAAVDAEPVEAQTGAGGADRPWGAATPWSTTDEFQPRIERENDGVPRWAAGETPDGFPDATEGGDPVDRGAIMAALEAAAEAVVAAEAAAESADQAEAAADVAETAAELVVGRTGGADDLDPEAQAAFSARVDAGGYDTESFTDRLASLMPNHEAVEDDGSPRTTQVMVSGLVSVASIASFKRHLGRIPGVDNVAVASGPDGEFVFNVTHRADVSFRDAVPSMPGFAARVTSSGDGIVTVTARDPEAEG